MSATNYKAQCRTPLNYNDNQANYFPPQYGREDQVGDLRIDFDPVVGHRVFRFVLLATTSANVTGVEALWYSDNYKQTVTTVVGGNSTQPYRNAIAGAGQYVSQSAAGNTTVPVITAGNKGWIQVAGWHPGVNTGANCTIGATIIPDVQPANFTNTSAGTAPTYQECGIVLGNSTGGGAQAGLTPVQLQIPE